MIEREVAIRQLARDIAQCSELKSVSLDSGHPCRTVANASRAGDFRQLPEAWVGNLETARLMILSSNPTISVEENPKKQELFPLGGSSNPEIEHPEWPIDRVLDFQLNRFEQQRETPYVLPEARYLTVAGSYVNSTNRYWTQSFRIGREIFGSEFQMERDIVLTEVVHCKSKKEIGVKEAVATCSRRYLNRLLGLTMAQLVVIAGAQARDRVHELRQMKADVAWDVDDDFGFLPTTTVGLKDLKAVDRRKHLGIVRCGQRHLPIVALQQLSMGSNPCRSLTSLLGVTGTNQLSDVVLGKTSLDLSAMSGSEFANFVLSQVFTQCECRAEALPLVAGARRIIRNLRQRLKGVPSGARRGFKWLMYLGFMEIKPGANLEGANLEGADLEWSDLEGANLRRANLRNANLYFSNLRNADLRSADLRGANCQRALMVGTRLDDAQLDGADFGGAMIEKSGGTVPLMVRSSIRFAIRVKLRVLIFRIRRFFKRPS